MPSWIIRWTLCGCEWEDKSEVERVKLLLRRKQLHCLWGKTICVTSDLQGVTADTWGADHSSCLMWCCALLSMWGKRKERRDFDTRYFHSSARSCVLLWSCVVWFVCHACFPVRSDIIFSLTALTVSQLLQFTWDQRNGEVACGQQDTRQQRSVLM